MRFLSAGGLSTLEKTLDSSRLERKRYGDGNAISVNTVSLNDLLRENDAPEVIDFLSVDTEGSELAILSSFDFSRHKFNAIAVEHNFGSQRAKIQNVLERAGYRRVFNYISRWDDWYIPAGY